MLEHTHVTLNSQHVRAACRRGVSLHPNTIDFQFGYFKVDRLHHAHDMTHRTSPCLLTPARQLEAAARSNERARAHTHANMPSTPRGQFCVVLFCTHAVRRVRTQTCRFQYRAQLLCPASLSRPQGVPSAPSSVSTAAMQPSTCRRRRQQTSQRPLRVRQGSPLSFFSSCRPTASSTLQVSKLTTCQLPPRSGRVTKYACLVWCCMADQTIASIIT